MLALSALPVHAQVVQQDILAAAGVDARARYGVANAMDTLLFPRSDFRPGGIVLDSAFAPGLVHVTDLTCAGEGLPCVRPVDMTAATAAFAVNSRYVGVYYASSFNYVDERSDQGPLGSFIAFAAPITTPLLAPMTVGPTRVIPDTSEAAIFGTGMEYSLGARVFVPVGGGEQIAGSIGVYVAGDRSGAYTTFTDEQVRLVVSTLLTDQLPYLLGGLRGSSWIWRAVEPLGRRELASSLFVRKIGLQKGAGVLPQSSDLAATAPPLWTAHAEQFALGPLDLHVAVTLQPVVQLHEARVTFVHLRDDVRCFVDGGVVQLPAAPWLGAEGGLFPTAEAGCGLQDEGLELARLSLGVNTPETLVAFPYARTAVLGRLTFTIAPAEGGWE